MTCSKKDDSIEFWNPATGQRFTVMDDMCPLVEIFSVVSSKVSTLTSDMFIVRKSSFFIHLAFINESITYVNEYKHVCQ